MSASISHSGERRRCDQIPVVVHDCKRCRLRIEGRSIMAPTALPLKREIKDYGFRGECIRKAET